MGFILLASLWKKSEGKSHLPSCLQKSVALALELDSTAPSPGNSHRHLVARTLRLCLPVGTLAGKPKMTTGTREACTPVCVSCLSGFLGGRTGWTLAPTEQCGYSWEDHSVRVSDPCSCQPLLGCQRACGMMRVQPILSWSRKLFHEVWPGVCPLCPSESQGHCLSAAGK